MRIVYLSDTVDCDTFREFVYHFQADELAEADREKLQEHLDRCKSCARYLEVEDSFRAALKGKLRRAETPEGLESRIREALAQEAPAPGRRRWAWLWSPVATSVAAALLLVAVIVPGLRYPGGSSEGGLRVVRSATIVDEDCDRAGATLEQQRACRDSRHLNVLKVADGMYWHVNPDGPLAKDIVLDPAQRGRRVVVEGDYYPELHTVQLIDVRNAI